MASSSIIPFKWLLFYSLFISQLISIASSSSSSSPRPRIIKFYVQQENEFATFPAGSNLALVDHELRSATTTTNSSSSSASNTTSPPAASRDRPLNSPSPGASIAYEYAMTREANPSSEVMGYVRGTAVVVSEATGGSIANGSTLFFVSNVIHFSTGEWAGSSISQQGEAVFSEREPWELAIVGGTADFRHATGYNVGRLVATSRTAHNATRLTTRYHAHLSYPKTT